MVKLNKSEKKNIEENSNQQQKSKTKKTKHRHIYLNNNYNRVLLFVFFCFDFYCIYRILYILDSGIPTFPNKKTKRMIQMRNNRHIHIQYEQRVHCVCMYTIFVYSNRTDDGCGLTVAHSFVVDDQMNSVLLKN